MELKEVDTFFDKFKVWSKHITIYLPVNDGETFLPDRASSLALQTFLKMCGIKYRVEYKNNVEDISPTGQVPILKCGICLLSGLETIVDFFEKKGVSLNDNLDYSQKAEIKAYLSLVNMTLVNAENFIIWADEVTFKTETSSKFASAHPWPLNWILAGRKQQKVLKKLKTLGWLNKSLEDVCREVDICFSVLSEKLEGEYFIENKPSELDAVVFAHVYTILTASTETSKIQFAKILHWYPNIVEYCQKISSKYFPEFSLEPIDNIY